MLEVYKKRYYWSISGYYCYYKDKNGKGYYASISNVQLRIKEFSYVEVMIFPASVECKEILSMHPEYELRGVPNTPESLVACINEFSGTGTEYVLKEEDENYDCFCWP